ncbi:SCL-interrupting locus protein homolog isoform X2 [Penaeus japonicus]|uniref:SCL-interrupting locus protein homolog isoform X2 n=1 Tax=Penaeus japonicus TaxID=27405 RepID=UPI001C713FED|nr:SCL-interrupting locus protein homolog isoform X2 [Penaeus japonicus]
MMDDDAAPRQAPPPKPSMVPYNVPRPVVPEVSLMFDSEDSLIWQQPKSGLPQKKDVPFTKGGSAAVNPRVPVVSGKQAFVSVSQREIQGFQSTTQFRNRPEEDFTRAKLPLQSRTEGQFQRDASGSPVLKTPVISEKHYNPLIYSPSQKNTSKEMGYSSTPPSREFSPLVTGNTVAISKVLTPQTQNTVSSPSYEGSANLSKNSWPSQVTTKSVHFYKSPVMSDEETALHSKRMEQHQRSLQTYGREKENVKPYSPPVSEPRRTEPNNFAPTYRKDFNTPTSAQYSSRLVTQGGGQSSNRELNEHEAVRQSDHVSGRASNQCDPNVYRLIEKQNEHIFRLQSSLEKLLEKQEHSEALRIKESRELLREIVMATSANQKVNQRQIFKDTCSQTEPIKPETHSVGTNTEISWSDLIASAMPSENAVEKDLGQDARFEPREAVKFQTNNRKLGEKQAEVLRNNYKAKAINRRDSSSRQAANWTVHKEMSLTMQEVVMKTIEEDPPSPDPSMHISMTEYHDGSRHEEDLSGRRNEKKSVEWDGSPVLGESASMCSPAVHESPQQHEGAKATEPTGVTFYNNVMTNIQHILQNSQAAEEEERNKDPAGNHHRQKETKNEKETTVIDPQMEAVRKQLMQFGISFIDPATLATNNRPVLDTMYLPGLHNMLSMYQSSIPNSGVMPYQETDATAAKYLTDAQLAAIAAASPAMTGRTRSARETNPLRPPYQQVKNTETENNFSIATKKFLGKYGLQEDD